MTDTLPQTSSLGTTPMTQSTDSLPESAPGPSQLPQTSSLGTTPMTQSTDSMPESSPGPSQLPEEVGNWWSRKCGVREVMNLALPLVISTMSWTIMNFVDRMFLLWHSQEEMAAAA